MNMYPFDDLSNEGLNKTQLKLAYSSLQLLRQNVTVRINYFSSRFE